MKPKFRKVVFVVTYSIINSKIYYLILKRKLHWNGWEFPKGGMKQSETKENAVKRELKEETGLRPLKIKKFDISGKYKYDKEYPDRKGIIGQNYTLFAVKVKKKKIKPDRLEHSGYKWTNFKQATKKLKWLNQRKCLKIVKEWLENEDK